MRKSASRRRALTIVIAVAVVLAILGGYNLRMHRQGSSSGAIATPQKIHNTFVRENDILSLSEQQLSKRMRYWEFSKKIDSEPPGQLNPRIYECKLPPRVPQSNNRHHACKCSKIVARRF